MAEYVELQRVIHTERGWVTEDQATGNGTPCYRLVMTADAFEHHNEAVQRAVKELGINLERVYINDLHGKPRALDAARRINERVSQLI